MLVIVRHGDLSVVDANYNMFETSGEDTLQFSPIVRALCSSVRILAEERTTMTSDVEVTLSQAREVLRTSSRMATCLPSKQKARSIDVMLATFDLRFTKQQPACELYHFVPWRIKQKEQWRW
jgi:hypothetical protein